MRLKDIAWIRALYIPVRTLFRKVFGSIRLYSHKTDSTLKIVVGASGYYDPGWIPTDKDYLDITNIKDWDKFFYPSSIDAILAEHVLEHLTESQNREFLVTCRKYLKSTGYIRIAVPDAYHCDKNYRESMKVNGTAPGSDDHKVFFDFQSITQMLNDAGYDVSLLEYFDENGNFQFMHWNPDDGLIRRSLKFDARNKDKQYAFTSLIVDARPS